MAKISYSSDVDILLVEFSDKPLDHAEEAGQFIVHLSKGGEVVQLEILDAQDFLVDSLRAIVKKAKAQSKAPQSRANVQARKPDL
jgi:uncharacterized protein YuzE